jgi:purine-binding chemotaxis protein CheW
VLLATFFVRDALCALDAARVQEVIGLGPVTPVHYAPEEVLGIVNLGGKIVTIVELGLRLGFSKATAGVTAALSSLKAATNSSACWWTGWTRLWRWGCDPWRPPPFNVNRVQAEFFKGVCRAGGRAITLLDARQVLAEGV